MPDQPALDQAKMEAFVHKVLGDTSAAMTTTLAALGDRLGLFKDLAANGPATSVELATRTSIDERAASSIARPSPISPAPLGPRAATTPCVPGRTSTSSRRCTRP